MSLSLLDKAYNFVVAVTKYVKEGRKNVDDSTYKARLEACDTCEYRKDHECTQCGCYVVLKAKWATERCPKNLWPEEDTSV